MEQLPAYYHDAPQRGKPPVKYVKFSAPEYQAGLAWAIPQLTIHDSRKGGLRSSRPLVLVQDKDPAHIAHSTAAFCAKLAPRPLHLITLPTTSPDLTPMDAGFFGTVKGRWNRMAQKNKLPWAERCRLALKLLEEEDPEKYIREMPLRWQACEEVRGGHIEAKLKQLKRQL
jgi:hypothetical protein